MQLDPRAKYYITPISAYLGVGKQTIYRWHVLKKVQFHVNPINKYLWLYGEELSSLEKYLYSTAEKQSLKSSLSIDSDRTYTKEEAAELLGMSRRSIERYLSNGVILFERVKPHNRVLIKGRELQKLVS